MPSVEISGTPWNLLSSSNFVSGCLFYFCRCRVLRVGVRVEGSGTCAVKQVRLRLPSFYGFEIEAWP